MGRHKISEPYEAILIRKRNAIIFRIARAAFGFTQIDVAEKVGLSFSAIAKFERGTIRLNSKSVKLIFSIFESEDFKINYENHKINMTLNDKFISKLIENSNLKIS